MIKVSRSFTLTHCDLQYNIKWKKIYICMQCTLEEEELEEGESTLHS